MYQPKRKALLAFLVICIFVLSGCTKESTEAENPIPQKGWQKVGDLTVSAAGAFTFEKDGKLYVASGEVLDHTVYPKTYTYSMHELDGSSKTMKKLASFAGNAHLSASNTAAFMVGESVYFYFTSNNTLLSYNTVTNAWLYKASIPDNYGEPTPSRYAIGAYTQEGKGYVFLGIIQPYLQMDMVQQYQYDPVSNAWTSVKLWGASMEYAARGFRADSSFYIMSNTKRLYRHKIGTTTLENLGTTPSSLLALSPFVVVNGGKALVGTGGEFTVTQSGDLFSDNTSEECWTLNFTTHTWTKVENFGGGKRRGAIGYLYNNEIYVFGGESGNAETKKIERRPDLWKYVE